MEPLKKLWPAPKNLKSYALSFYKRVGQQLIDHEVLTEFDKEALLSLSSAYGLMMLSQDDINKYGVNIPGARDGDLKKNPAFTTYKMASDIYAKLSKRFYLTPGDRAHAKIEKPAPKTEKEQFFS